MQLDLLKRVYQEGKSDCLQACLATLLNIEYLFIPKWYENYNSKHYSEEIFWNEVGQWLDNNGYFYTWQKYDIDYLPCISSKIFHCIGFLKKEENKSHAVVLELVNCDGNDVKLKIWHDPKKDSDSKIADLSSIMIIGSSI